MLSPVEDRLKASIKMDVINGDSFEKSIFIKQILEAIQTIKELRKRKHAKNTPNTPQKMFSWERKQQSKRVMPLIGPLLDIWDWLANDVKSEPELGRLKKIIENINAGMVGKNNHINKEWTK